MTTEPWEAPKPTARPKPLRYVINVYPSARGFRYHVLSDFIPISSGHCETQEEAFDHVISKLRQRFSEGG